MRPDSSFWELDRSEASSAESCSTWERNKGMVNKADVTPLWRLSHLLLPILGHIRIKCLHDVHG